MYVRDICNEKLCICMIEVIDCLSINCPARSIIDLYNLSHTLLWWCCYCVFSRIIQFIYQTIQFSDLNFCRLMYSTKRLYKSNNDNKHLNDKTDLFSLLFQTNVMPHVSVDLSEQQTRNLVLFYYINFIAFPG